MCEVHPHADPDGILRDGDCRPYFYQLLVRDSLNSLQVLSAMFAKFNAQMFGGILPVPELRIETDFDVEGRLVWEETPMVLQVCEEAILDGYERLRDTLLHEMCHLYVRAVLGDTGPVSHGTAWRHEADRLGVFVSETEFEEVAGQGSDV